MTCPVCWHPFFYISIFVNRTIVNRTKMYENFPGTLTDTQKSKWNRLSKISTLNSLSIRISVNRTKMFGKPPWSMTKTKANEIIIGSKFQSFLRELSLPLLFLSQRFPASLNVVFTPEAVKMWVTSLPNPRPISNFNLLKPMLHLHPAFYMSLLFRIINCLGDYSILAWRIVVWYYFGRDRDQANIFHCRYHLNPHKMIKLPITTAFRTKCLFAWMQVHFI